jgi:hypothetical protein
MWAFLVTLALTLYMTGMIWSMQAFEYPLFALVGRQEFTAYHAAHNRRLPVFVILPSLLALISAILLFWIRPASIPLWSVALAVALDLVVIVSTVARLAPLHERLDRGGYSAEVIGMLVRDNWIRTIAWTANALLLLGMAATALASAK